MGHLQTCPSSAHALVCPGHRVFCIPHPFCVCLLYVFPCPIILCVLYVLMTEVAEVAALPSPYFYTCPPVLFMLQLADDGHVLTASPGLGSPLFLAPLLSSLHIAHSWSRDFCC